MFVFVPFFASTALARGKWWGLKRDTSKREIGKKVKLKTEKGAARRGTAVSHWMSCMCSYVRVARVPRFDMIG